MLMLVLFSLSLSAFTVSLIVSRAETVSPYRRHLAILTSNWLPFMLHAGAYHYIEAMPVTSPLCIVGAAHLILMIAAAHQIYKINRHLLARAAHPLGHASGS